MCSMPLPASPAPWAALGTLGREACWSWHPIAQMGGLRSREGSQGRQDEDPGHTCGSPPAPHQEEVCWDRLQNLACLLLTVLLGVEQSPGQVGEEEKVQGPCPGG